MNTKLYDILPDLEILSSLGQQPSPDCSVSDVCMDSRAVTPGAVFVCIKGYQADGHAYAASAYGRGARVFVAEHPLDIPLDAYQILVKDTRVALARLAAAFYGYPARRLRLVGLTGTKGKTTTAIYIRRILEEAGIPTGYIGTNGIDYMGIHADSPNSTPESLLLQKTLYRMAEAGVRAVVMEVSSQGLWMHRVEGLTFDATLFTNLSDDHIGTMEHPDMDHYMSCKRSLFTRHSDTHTCVICNADDPASPYMMQDVTGRVISVSADPASGAEYVGYDGAALASSAGLATSFTCRIRERSLGTYTLPTAGLFNIKNALCALAVACEVFGISPEDALRTLSHAHADGRLEVLTFAALPDVRFVIDYAHNGLSMASALDALRAYNPNRLICVFGSVGMRSKGRRAELAVAAGPRADLCILTSDNPGNENPMDILYEIDAAFPKGSCTRELISDRQEAIHRVVELAQRGDIILLAGKGHEQSQVIGGHTLPYNERDALSAAVAALTQGKEAPLPC